MREIRVKGVREWERETKRSNGFSLFREGN